MQFLEPIATVSTTCWNSIFVLLERLLLLYESTLLLTKRMIQNVDREIHKDRKKLETLLLKKNKLLGLKELVYLLEPFAKAIFLIANQWEDPVIEGYLASILDPSLKI
ncbi:8489_t:CDS:2 [Dentiscutata erythropus]|uniref:8489_t:CDS:1 n=1 Tax=Dentiscutata erythropus TaxID=1348616 RepID=A0A9N9J202_9GLOM|nr:8489_t:CDS:2 [Dentiscutata erythropus]